VKPTSSRVAASDPSSLFTGVRSLLLASARARRRARPGRGSDGLPFAALRVPSGTRPSGPSHNSLRSLRSLRSDRCDESVHEARWRARPEALLSSAAPIRPAHAAPGALPAVGSVIDAPPTTDAPATGHSGRAQRACKAPSSAGFEARARSALRELTRRACSTTVSAANEGSCATGPRARAAQGSRSEAKAASPERWAWPGCPVAALLRRSRESTDHNSPSVDKGISHAPRTAERRNAMGR